ncbi:hypothetical protein E3N88_12799 [Mikania micrantha]|uniref:Uncharacterized protein n=1 Tax=Mikania micrantha TaxID=192012 RepID=A0A5N6P6P6_9ASTR|nr:hypothetical protein E3N88_12799 [Mikania micrantha]
MSEKALPMTAGFIINVGSFIKFRNASEDMAFERSELDQKNVLRKTPSSEEYLEKPMLPKIMYRKSITSEGNLASEV